MNSKPCSSSFAISKRPSQVKLMRNIHLSSVPLHLSPSAKCKLLRNRCAGRTSHIKSKHFCHQPKPVCNEGTASGRKGGKVPATVQFESAKMRLCDFHEENPCSGAQSPTVERALNFPALQCSATWSSTPISLHLNWPI